MLQQMLALFGFFSLVLAFVFWVDQAVVILDELMGDGQTTSVFLEITALTLPAILSNLLPIAAFAATVYVVNRLSSEAELTVVQSAGYSPFRLARSTIVFGLIVTFLLGMLTHILVPLSQRELSVRSDQIAADLTARLFVEGTFIHPTPGVTFYVREITPADEFLDLYISATASEEDEDNVSFSAQRALVIEDDGEPVLLMFGGQSQRYNPETQILSVTDFESFGYNLSEFITERPIAAQEVRTTSTPRLLTNGAGLEATGAQIASEIARRSNQALQSLTVVLVGFGALLLGGFSRFGLWRQVFFAFLLLVAIKSADNSLEVIVRQTPELWPMRFIATLAGIAIAFLLMWRAATPVIHWRSLLGKGVRA